MGFNDAMKSLLNPRAWFHLFRMVHYYNYSHVQPLSKIVFVNKEFGSYGYDDNNARKTARISPTASFRNGERIILGTHAHIGERSSLWAGKTHAYISIGDNFLCGPDVLI